MAQIKKPEVREAILNAAHDLFTSKGYNATTMTKIAKTANMTVANLYVYFDSKLFLFYEIYRPWLIEQLNTLRDAVKRQRSPRAKLRRIIIGVWSDIPSKDGFFANAMIEALAAAPPGAEKPGNLLDFAETFVGELILDCLPEERRARINHRLLTHVIWMAFDGFVINRRIDDVRDVNEIADLMADLLLEPSK